VRREFKTKRGRDGFSARVLAEDDFEEMIARSKNLRPVFEVRRRFHKVPANFTRPDRVDKNYQRHARVSVGKRRLTLSSTRPFWPIPTEQWEIDLASDLLDHLLGVFRG